jgi:hypothetical protein
MIEYKFVDYTEMFLIYAKLNVKVKLHNASITNVFRVTSFHRIPFLSESCKYCEEHVLPSLKG